MLSRNAVRLALEISSQMTKEQQQKFVKELDDAQIDEESTFICEVDVKDFAEKVLNN